MDWNKVYFLSNETYLLNKSYFYTKYLSFESYLINLDCNILYVSQVKYLHEYLHNFNNYDKFTIENHCFYYILFSFQSIKYLIILFNTCDLENIWIFENFNIEIDGIENFIRIIFQYIYMRLLKIDISSFCKKYNLSFLSINNYSFLSIEEKKASAIKKIIRTALNKLEEEYNTMLTKKQTKSFS